MEDDFDHHHDIKEENGMNQSENRLYEAMRGIGLNPETQYKISRMKVDFAFPDKKIAIEVNGPYHDTPEQKKKDKKRWFVLDKKGWKVKTYKSGRVYSNPEKYAEKIKKLVGIPNNYEQIVREKSYESNGFNWLRLILPIALVISILLLVFVTGPAINKDIVPFIVNLISLFVIFALLLLFDKIALAVVIGMFIIVGIVIVITNMQQPTTNTQTTVPEDSTPQKISIATKSQSITPVVEEPIYYFDFQKESKTDAEIKQEIAGAINNMEGIYSRGNRFSLISAAEKWNVPPPIEMSVKDLNIEGCIPSCHLMNITGYNDEYNVSILFEKTDSLHTTTLTLPYEVTITR